MTTQAIKITFRHNSDYMVDNWADHPETDRDASVEAFNSGLARYLTTLYGSPVEVVDVPDLHRTEILLDPCPDDPQELQAQIQADAERYWEEGRFWVEPENV